MKVRDSGMPDEKMWAGFFDARRILVQLDFSDSDVVEFGCGYGTSIAAAGLPRTVHASTSRNAKATAARASLKTNIRVGVFRRRASGDGRAIFLTYCAIRWSAARHRVLRAAVGHSLGLCRGARPDCRPRPEQCQWVRRRWLVIPIMTLPPTIGMVGRRPQGE